MISDINARRAVGRNGRQKMLHRLKMISGRHASVAKRTKRESDIRIKIANRKARQKKADQR